MTKAEPADQSCTTRQLETTNGASIAIVTRAGEDKVVVRDADSRIVFEFDPTTNRATLTMPAGDLAVHAPGGNIDLVAGGSVRLRAAKSVELEAGEGESRSSLEVAGTLSRWSARAIELSVGKAEMAIQEATYSGRSFAAKLVDAKVAMERFESVTGKLFERARSVFRTVEDLHQLRAGRARTIVEEGLVVRSGHTSLGSREETKIDASQIHLG